MKEKAQWENGKGGEEESKGESKNEGRNQTVTEKDNIKDEQKREKKSREHKKQIKVNVINEGKMRKRKQGERGKTEGVKENEGVTESMEEDRKDRRTSVKYEDREEKEGEK